MQDVLTIAEIKEAVSAVSSKYGVDRVFLFGSYARGEATQDSDVDLRIDRGDARGFALGGVYNDIRNALKKNLDLCTTGSLSAEFLSSIKDEEILLYEKIAT